LPVQSFSLYRKWKTLERSKAIIFRLAVCSVNYKPPFLKKKFTWSKLRCLPIYRRICRSAGGKGKKVHDEAFSGTFTVYFSADFPGQESQSEQLLKGGK